jgi:hypothetical protein
MRDAMPDTTLSTTVNSWMMERLGRLAQATPVVVSEDIVDSHGMRLLARGTALNAGHVPLLARRTLKKALEAMLVVPAAPDVEDLVAIAARLLEDNAPVSRILGTTCGAGPAPLSLLASMDFGHPMRMLLALTGNEGPHALEHAVTVSLLAMCMAKRQHLSADDQLSAGLAGLLHDIGELYIDPAWLAPDKRLRPHEWAHLVGHPHTGKLLINELASYSLSVGRAVAEHHERFDGSGYPRQVRGHHISAPGQAVAVAEMIAGVLAEDHPLERAELALKIIPGEHAHDLLSAISGALRSQPGQGPDAGECDPDAEDAERLYWRISTALETGQTLLDGTTVASPRARELLKRTLERVTTLLRAYVSTGLDAWLEPGHDLHGDAAIRFEKQVATREIQWRLRDLARDLALQTAASPDEKSAFAGMIHLLDDDVAGSARYARKAAPAAPLAARAPTSFAGSLPYAR